MTYLNITMLLIIAYYGLIAPDASVNHHGRTIQDEQKDKQTKEPSVWEVRKFCTSITIELRESY